MKNKGTVLFSWWPCKEIGLLCFDADFGSENFFSLYLEKVIKREVTLVNKGKIAKLAQMWRLLPPNLEFWEFFAMESWLVYILGHRQKFHEKTC